MADHSDLDRTSRRSVLRAALGATATLLPLRMAAADPSSPPHWRVPYGSAIKTDLLSDPAYRRAILAYCSIVSPEGCLKWPVVRPTRDQYHFDEADAYIRFAHDYGLTARGHTLVWGEVMPNWTASIGRGEAERILVDYIQTVVGRYAGRIASWDVINEPMAPVPLHAGDLRPSIWLATLGPRYIEIALRAAADADPRARLVINDYDVEYATAGSRTKRDGFLALVRGLADRGVPLHAVGIQGHLHGDRPIDREGLSAFVAVLKSIGLGVVVTELDVIDDQLPQPEALRDKLVADEADAFLGAIFDVIKPDAVLTWGLTDQFTWVPTWYKRGDGTPNRPLPLDANYRPKPLMAVLERYCR